MRSRRPPEEPVTRFATASRALGMFSVTVAAIGALLMRSGKVDTMAGLAVLGAAFVIAGLALLAALVAFVRVWRGFHRGFGPAATGLILALGVLAVPAAVAVSAAILPPLNDVSTDLVSPPAFSRSQSVLAARGGFAPGELPRETRELQRQSYPTVAPLTLEVEADEAFELVQEAARDLGWEVIETVPPGGRRGLGRLEAIDRTFLLRLPIDITVRVTPRADGARIDMRTVLRYSRHGLGLSLSRLTTFLDKVREEAEAQEE